MPIIMKQHDTVSQFDALLQIGELTTDAQGGM